MASFTFFKRLSSDFRNVHPANKLYWLLFGVSSSTCFYIAYGAPVTEKKKVVVLGTGWAGTSFLKTLDNQKYQVQVLSPGNHFAFTPLLPSVTRGTVEACSIVEPVSDICSQKLEMDLKFNEAECVKIDAENSKVYCRSSMNNNLNGTDDFVLDYDYLIIAVGAEVDTFNTPGVVENCHFLKEVEDAQKIRRTVIDCFERAKLPEVSEEEKKRILHFAIVGGGPTAMEFAASLHDFVNEDLVCLYPGIKDLVKITLLEAGDHILNMFDKRITAFAEDKFRRDGIDVKTGSMVVKVSEKEIYTKELKNGGEITAIPYGMAVWSTGIGTRPFIKDFMKQIGQTGRRALATNEWLRVEGCKNVYALGDCATINNKKVLEDITAMFKKADNNNTTGTLTVKEFQEVMDGICERYPQVELYLKNKQMRDIVDLLKEAKGDDKKESIELNIEELKTALSKVDSQMKLLPATAQVASQQGTYLASCFNYISELGENTEGPRTLWGCSIINEPFRYKHLCTSNWEGEQTAAQLPGDDWISIGHNSQWLWYSVYTSRHVSLRTWALVVKDWARGLIFGRDSVASEEIKHFSK